MTSETMDIILKIILSCLGILIPVGIKYLVSKVGKDPITRSMQIALLAKDFIIKFYKMNPELKATTDDILKLFKERVLVILPISEKELNFLFEQILGDIAEAIKIETSDTVVKLGAGIIDIDNIKKSDLLFK